MIKAGAKWAVIEYEKEDAYVPSASGIIVPSKRQQHLSLKGTTHYIGNDPDVDLPDMVRTGILVSGEIGVPVGTTVFFNKHEAFGFTLNEKYYYAIRADMVMASLSTQ